MTPRSPESRDHGPPPPAERDGQQSQQEPGSEASRDAHMMASPPKSTSKAASPAGGSRPRSLSKKTEPTLLTDFLKGRPSPARIAAERRKRQSLEAVKAEVRHEMKQGSVRRLQPPSGIHARVEAWQATNGSCMANADPNDAASEPTEVAFKDDVESVTEEDRVRIKLRQKKSLAPEDHARLNSPPKKRVVSDDNWRKRNKAKHSLPRNFSPKTKQPPSHKPLPPDFADKAGPDPAVSQKVKSWAAKVDVPETPPPSRRRASAVRSHGSPSSDTEETSSQETAKNAPQSARRGDDDIRVSPLAIKHNDSSRIAKHCKTKSADAGRVKDSARRLASPKSNEQPRPSWSRDWRSSDARNGNPLKSVPDKKPTRGRTQDSSVPSTSPRTLTPNDKEHSDRIEIVEYAESDLQTPPRPLSKSVRKSGAKTNTESPRSATHKPVEAASSPGEATSALDSPPHQDSDLASSLANRSVADIPGEIPFGHSAFSELDLSLNKSRPRRVKMERNSNLNVFKKVVEEGKKIIHDINETQKQHVPNKPPSIEKWLNSTVEPFAEKPNEPSLCSEEKPNLETSARRRSHSPTRARTTTPCHHEYKVDGQDIETSSDGKAAGRREPESPKDAKPAQAGGLRRARATRSSTFSPKPSSRRQLLGVLKEAFQGESSGHSTQPRSYQSQEERQYDDYSERQNRDFLEGRRSDGHGGSQRAPAPQNSHSQNSHSQYSHSHSNHSQSNHSQSSHSQSSPLQSSPHMAGPRFKPPTSGRHELSTIASEENCSTVESDLSSDATRTTLTQSTACTRDSEAGKERNHGPGLKRRLTRHSDLVSVLSLPDNSSIPSGIKDCRTRPSLRRTRNSSDDVTSEELLQEFADDENLYLRELRTLVDGVVPVLLSHVVTGTQASDLFGQGSSGSSHGSLAKSVVDMGVALEKLKNAHRKAPTGDLRKLSNWAHGVVPIYHNYLRAWRLGFEDVVVNLAPAADSCPDEDSLLNALPRNDKGDIIDRHGERVAVAHLLKRPLVRVKQMTRFFKCVDAMMGSDDTRNLVQDLDDLQEKTRQRHREEVARSTDQDAANTDVSKTREMRTLEALGNVTIDGSLQVNAKDLFSLNLSHSNGQRLECQAELVHRDNSKRPEEPGDLLIRETGHGRRTYLLFEPIPMGLISARRGKDELDLVVMIRGTHCGEAWYQLLDLVSESPDQVQDWLDILPSSPVPPAACQVDGAGKQKEAEAAASAQPPESPKPPIDNDLTATVADCKKDMETPHRAKRASLPSNLSAGVFAEPESPSGQDKWERSRPLSESMRPDADRLMRDSRPKDASERDAEAPPLPPAHQSRGASSAVSRSKPKLQAASESKDEGRLKRRGSSPLKHEYLPSDASSTGDEYSSDSESSDDDLDSSDIPQTELGLSIKKEGPGLSECSLAPSNSASQAGLYGPQTAPEAKAERFMASISRWSDQGVWADLASLPCSIIVTAGLIEAYALGTAQATSSEQPIVALDLTPVVLIRQSTALDLEIRSSVQPHCQIYRPHVLSGGNFRFRCHGAPECYALYMAVHHARLNNQKFIQLANEARFRSFGQDRPPDASGLGACSGRGLARRSWFGRKRSYRGSVRAPPPQSHDGASTTPSSTPSASTFLRRLTTTGNLAFNIARSSIGRQGAAAAAAGCVQTTSLYTSCSSSSSSAATWPRSPSLSLGSARSLAATCNPAGAGLAIRLHLLVAAAKWEDWGNCTLQIRRPPPGWHQALRANHGLEKRVTATTKSNSSSSDAAPRVLLDAVLGSGCFSPMGSRGIVCGVWEELRSAEAGAGWAPATGATGGTVKKWCFQFATVAEASCVLRLVHQEVFAP